MKIRTARAVLTPLAVQEDHDLPYRLLFGPGGQNARGTDRRDAIDLAQPVRSGLDDIEDFVAEGAHELFGIDLAIVPRFIPLRDLN